MPAPIRPLQRVTRARLVRVGLWVGVGLACLTACRKTGGVPGLPLTDSPLTGSGASLSAAGGTFNGHAGKGGTSSAGSGGIDDAGEAGAGGAAELPDGGTPVFSREALLAAVADCMVEQARRFEDEAVGLVDTTAAHASEPPGVDAATVQNTWASAMALWQRLEVWQFGPLGESMSVAGGEDRRVPIYGWPAFNRCTIDQYLVAQRYLDSDFGTALKNALGLGAVEYVVFYPGSDNGCLPTQAINSTGSWVNLGEAELALRKADYAHAVAVDVAIRAGELVARWAPESGNFRSEFASAGNGSAIYPSTQAAFNALSDALFYLDTEVKDMKLAWVMGLSVCEGPCPVPAESPFAGLSKAHLRNNLLGFRSLYQGCAPGGSGLGFDDMLDDMGQTELAERMRVDIAGAIAAVDALEEPSIEAAQALDPASVQALYAAVKRVTDALKSDFVNVLDLEPPMGAGDDTD